MLLFPSLNGKERDFLDTIDNAAYSIVSEKARHHRREKSPVIMRYKATAHASK